MDYKKTTWRVIQHPPAEGAWNMAVDEAILESIIAGEAPPTLRLYAWQPGCLSLGRAQPFSDVDTLALAKNGWDVVRRPTGGRAILHIDELTYAVIAPETEPRVEGGVLESYLRLSEALLRALELIGLAAQANEKDANKKPKKTNPVCFEVASNYEITVKGKKLIGSAQARRKAGILQHGTLPLYGDLDRIITALYFPDDKAHNQARKGLLQHAATVEQVLGITPTWQAASDAFQKAFQDVLNLDLVPGSLTEGENQKAHELMQKKYAHSSWTERI